MELLTKTFKTFAALIILGFLAVTAIVLIGLVFFFCAAVFAQVSIFWGFMSVIVVLFLIALAANALSGKTEFVGKCIDLLMEWL